MTIVLLIVAIALTVVARFAPAEKEIPRSRPSFSAMVSLAITTIALLVVALKFGSDVEHLATCVGLVAGAAAVLGGEFLGGLVASIGVAVAASLLAHLFPVKSVDYGQFAIFVGLAIGAICVPGRSATMTAIVGAVCVAGDFLGSDHKNVPGSIVMGSLLGLGGLFALAAYSWMPKKIAAYRPLAMTLLIALVGFIVSKRIDEPQLAIVGYLGGIAGLVVHYLVPDDERDLARLIVAAIISMTTATIAYGLYRNAGIVAELIIMVLILLGNGNRSATLTTTLVFGILLMRLLKWTDADLPQALDIGQHFTLLGLFLGAVLPYLVVDRENATGWKGAAITVMWTVLIVAACVFVLVMLGHRGMSGLVVGLGLSGIVGLLRDKRSLLPLAIAPGLMSICVFLLDKFDAWSDFSKQEKIRFFAIGAMAVIVVALAIGVLSRPVKSKEVVA